MKNIILQHWEPREPSKPMPMIVEKSIENISAYAERMGVRSIDFWTENHSKRDCVNNVRSVQVSMKRSMIMML